MVRIPRALHQGLAQIQLLQRSLGLPLSDAKWLADRPAPTNPVLVSIDCEWNQNKVITEIGVSILDTLHLKNLSIATSTIPQLQDTISTYNFTFPGLGPSSRPVNYMFDHFAQVKKDELRKVLYSLKVNNESGHSSDWDLCHHFKDEHAGSKRNIIIVGQSFDADALMLAREKFSLPDAPILDTMHIATRILAYKKPRPLYASLGGLMEQFEIPYNKHLWHNGGNDSHFTLRVLLMLAVHSLGWQQVGGKAQEMKNLLEAIAKMPLMRHDRFDGIKYDLKTRYDNKFWLAEALARRTEGGSV